jgi:hypothetical protein
MTTVQRMRCSYLGHQVREKCCGTGSSGLPGGTGAVIAGTLCHSFSRCHGEFMGASSRYTNLPRTRVAKATVAFALSAITY